MIYGALGDIEEYRGMLKGLDVLILSLIHI